MSRAPESPSVSSVPAAVETARPVGALAPGRGSAQSSFHCSRCGKLKLTRSGAPHTCRADEMERIRTIEAALEFYADLGNYGIGGGSSERIYADAGKLARAALRALPNQ